MKIFKLLSFVSLLAIFTSCVNSDEYNTPDLSGECVNLTATKTVAEITNAATGTATIYQNEDIIEAYVTSSDEGGNFYKSISFQSVDGTKGFSMPVDTYNLFNQYEPGRLVYIYMKDRYVATSQSSTVIGSLYENSVGRISGVEYNNVLKRSCTKVDENSIVKKNLTIATASNDQYLNMLLEFENVQFTSPSLGKTFYDSTLNSIGGATNHTITDDLGKSIIVRVSEFANFASNEIPQGSGKIRGVLTKYNGVYQFMIRTLNDVNLTEPRFKLLLNETFDAGSGEWTSFSVTGAQVWTYSPNYGYPGQFNSGGMMKMSGYSNGNVVNEDWLISPEQDLTSLVNGATLSFENAYNYSGNPIQVYISNNYSGTGNPNAAGVTWTQLSPILSTGGFQYSNSGALNINSFTGVGNNSVYVAFKYTSTTSAASTWEIDNVKITPL